MRACRAVLVFLVVWLLAFIPASLLVHLQTSSVIQDSFFFWLTDQWLVEGTVLCASLAVLLAAWGLRSASHYWQATWWPGWCLWLVWCGFSLHYSLDAGASMRRWLLLLGCGLTACAASAVAQAPDDGERLIRRVGAAAAAVGIYGLWQFLGSFSGAQATLDQWQASNQITMRESWWAGVLGDIFSRRRVSAVFGWPTLYAGFLLLVLPVTAALRASAVRPEARGWWLAVAVLLIASLVATLSPIAWGAGLLTFFLWQALRRRTWRPVLFGAAAVVVVALVSVLWPRGPVHELMMGSLSSRAAYVGSAVSVVAEHPLRGTGLGTYGIMHARLAAGAHSAKNAHNTLAQFAAETGLVGLALFIAWLWPLAKVVMAAIPQKSKEFGLREAVAVGVLGFFIHSLVEQTFFEPMLVPLWWLLVGWLTATRPQGPARAGDSQQKHKPVAGVAAAVAGLCLGGSFVLADGWALRADRLAQKQQWQQAAAAFAQAQAWNPLESRYPIQWAGHLLRQAKQASAGQRVGLLRQARQPLTRAVILSGWSGALWQRLGWLRWQLGDFSGAIAATRAGLRVDPQSGRSLAQLRFLLKARSLQQTRPPRP